MSDNYLDDTKLNLSGGFPYPYVPEEFTPKEKKILSQFFTNWDKPVFAIFNLPQEVIGAMFSRYSRTAKSVRRVFLDEFWSPEIGISGNEKDSLEKAKARTQDFYRRVFAEYGDDSVIQMGSVHISFEYVSQLAAKAIEDQRVASAYIEKSTRYVDFGNKVNDRYLYMDVPEIVNSKFAKDYKKWNEMAFKLYVKHTKTIFNFLKKKYALKSQIFVNPVTGERGSINDIKDEEVRLRAEKAYERALKAKTFDTVRLFLPITMVANMGAHFSGQAAENTINKMLISPHAEVRTLGKMAYEELMKVSPSFLQHVNHRYGDVARNYRNEILKTQREYVSTILAKLPETKDAKDVTLIDWDRDADVRIASQLLFTGNADMQVTKKQVYDWAAKTKKRELKASSFLDWSPKLLGIIIDSVPKRNTEGLNRRHKLPRAFEHANIEIELYTDYGVYKDLQRNRLSSTERQKITANGIYIPAEYKEKGMKAVLEDYKKLARVTKDLRKSLVKSGEENLVSAAEYIAIHGNKVRYSIRASIRQWVFFAELRTISGGHPTYRVIMQKCVNEILGKMPFLKPLFAHVDWKKDYGLGRLSAEIRTQEKLAKLVDTRN